jgi:glycosyltransferase involved in cell wall biosynthesis
VSDGRVVAIVPAHDEADVIASTVAALRTIPDLSSIVVADDGSGDETARIARDAGATVLRSARRSGKGEAIEAALRRLSPANVWLLADGDLADSAGGLRGVLEEVRSGRADVAVAVLPHQSGGGFGIIRRLAGWGIRRTCGFAAEAPLSGQRALTARALAAVRPLANGYGVETAMTIDAVRAGLRVVEVAAPLTHRATGRGPGGFAHRGRQALDIGVALLRRRR